ncbi:MAG: biotin-dependent carboxyltransferase family protein [Tepidisphaeraceae bacterium]
MIVVESPGLLTTVQDLGRPMLRANGLPPGGAADTLSLRIANLIVGNPENAAALECALVGPMLRFKRAAVVAVCGARVAGIASNSLLRVPAGGRLSLGRIERGVYAYVAVAGGIDVPEVLGSRATDVRLGFGGHHGRKLAKGDTLPVGVKRATPAFGLTVSAGSVFEDVPVIRIVDGRDSARVADDWTKRAYAVSSKSDRVGIRLDGEALAITSEAAAQSSAVFPGTIQLPGDGRPIILAADAQTLGGYPQIGHVIRADLPRLVQICPGSAVRFGRVSLEEAHAALRRQEKELALLRTGIRLRTEAHAGD